MKSLNLNGTFNRKAAVTLSGPKSGKGSGVPENSRRRWFRLKLNFSLLIMAVLLSLPFALSSKISLFSEQQSKKTFQKQVTHEFPVFSHIAKSLVKEAPLYKLPGIDLFEIEEESRPHTSQKNLNEKLQSDSALHNRISITYHLTGQLLILPAVSPFLNVLDRYIRLRVLRI